MRRLRIFATGGRGAKRLGGAERVKNGSAMHTRMPTAGQIWRRLRRALPRLFLPFVLLCLFVLGAAQLWRLAQLCPGWSLRYNTPIPGVAAATARAAAAENPEDGLWPTFWREETLPLQSELGQSESPCILYSGEGDLVWPARFTAGGWPGATDEGGCVVSESLAFRLWGSHDVLGRRLAVGERTCTVRGVLRQGGELCILQTDGAAGLGSADSPGWQGVELRAAPGLARGQIDTFLRAGGLAQPGAVLPGGGVVALGAWMLALPAIPALLWMLVRRVVRAAKKAPVAARVAGGLLLLALALALPLLLGLLPAWALPARWSDFSHWPALLGQLDGFIDTLLLLPPALRDAAMKQALLWILALGCAAAPLWLCLAHSGGKTMNLYSPRLLMNTGS